MQEVKNRFSGADVEVGLLDVLVTLAENVKLLVAGSLLVGLCALGIGFMLPQTYQSVAVLQAEQPTASLLMTAVVLDPVIEALGLAKDETLEAARIRLRERIKVAIGRNDKLMTLTVSGPTPQQAQDTASALIYQTYQQSRPKGSVRTRLEAQLAEARLRLKNAQEAATSLLKQLEKNGAGTGGEIARGYADLLGATGTAQGQISKLETELEGLTDAQLVQFPTLPQKSSQPKKGLIAIGATLAAGLALLLFVFMRQALRNTAGNEKSSAKLLRIRKSLGLR